MIFEPNFCHPHMASTPWQKCQEKVKASPFLLLLVVLSTIRPCRSLDVLLTRWVSFHHHVIDLGAISCAKKSFSCHSNFIGHWLCVEATGANSTLQFSRDCSFGQQDACNISKYWKVQLYNITWFHVSVVEWDTRTVSAEKAQPSSLLLPVKLFMRRNRWKSYMERSGVSTLDHCRYCQGRHDGNQSFSQPSSKFCQYHANRTTFLGFEGKE